MLQKTFMCCYGNNTTFKGDKVLTGWGNAFVSPNTPKEAYSNCEIYQKNNSSISGEMLDEQGNSLNLFEIYSDKKYLYLIKSFYDVTDYSGRKSMFSHAYILLWDEDDILKTPNLFLNVDQKSFKNNIDEAKNSSLKLEKPFMTLEKAYEISGLNEFTHLRLIQCIYAQNKFLENSPLYIKYDGSIEQMMAVLYCVYNFIPFYIRKILNICTDNSRNTSLKNIVFSKSKSQNNYNFDLKTGEENILNERFLYDVQKDVFLQYPFYVSKKMFSNQFFCHLDNEVQQLGDDLKQNSTAYTMAFMLNYQKNIDDIGEQSLLDFLYDSTNVNFTWSEKALDFIANLFDIVTKRNLDLSENFSKLFIKTFKNIGNEKLHNSIENYESYMFFKVPNEVLFKKLSAMDSKKFDYYKNKMEQNRNLFQALMDYYQYLIEQNCKTCKDIDKLIKKYPCLKEKNCKNLIFTNYWNIYECSIENENAYENFCSFKNYISDNLSKEKVDKIILIAKKIYSQKYSSIKNMQIDKYSEYLEMFSGETDEEIFILSFLEILNKTEFDFSHQFQNILDFIIQKCFQLEEDDFTNVISEIKKYIIAKAGDRANYYNLVLDIIISCKNSDEIENFKKLLSELNSNNYYDFIWNYYNNFYKLNLSYLDKVEELMFLICFEKDSVQAIPLDIWIVISAKPNKNCFEILENVDMSILKFAPEITANGTLALRNNIVYSQAIEYLKGKSSGELAKYLRKVFRIWKNQKNKTKNKECKSLAFLKKFLCIFKKK